MNPRPREEEAYYYIAETIATFDLVAMQEVNRNLEPFQKIMKLLGAGWDYIVTNTTEGTGGNSERMAFVFKTGVVRFRHIAVNRAADRANGLARFRSCQRHGRQTAGRSSSPARRFWSRSSRAGSD